MNAADPACVADGDEAARRFGGLIRLYGDAGFARIRAAHAVVVGIGGVGSWAAEALARSGVGTLTLIDLDVVAESNLNRQAHATLANLGRNKVDAMRDRIASFAPTCQVVTVDDFVTPENVAQRVPAAATLVIDAIDQVRAKAALVAHCAARGQPVVVCGGAGGKTDPSCFTVADLAQTAHDALLAKLRVALRRDYGFPRGERKFRVSAVYSTEPQAAAPEDGGAGLACAGYGSAMHMTASMGLMAAGVALKRLAALAE
ncbi:MAG: tRNA threonylcarbamoyladenosine dehydratase [Burkholderiales bacterium]|nr:tRNA threonylcarbamoyladenosine dehydratase [Burkholderiales bacterium]